MSQNGSFISTPRTLTSNSTKEHNISAAVTFGGIAIFIAFENFLVVYAVAVKKFRRVPDILIFALSVSSLMNSFTVLAIVVYHRAVDNTGKDGIDALCKTQFWFATTLRTADIFTTTLISLDRYIAITKPFFYRARVRPMHGWWAISVTAFISCFISVLPFIGFGSISRIVPSLCVARWDSKVSVLIVAIAYIQFAVVLFCYIAVIWTIKKLVKRQKAMAKSQQITYDSPRINRRNLTSSVSLNLSVETSSTSLDAPSFVDGPAFIEGPVSLRIKAALNRSLSNFEGAQSETFGLRTISQQFPAKNDSNEHLKTPDNAQGELKRSATCPDGLPKARPISRGNEKRGSLPDDNYYQSGSYKSWNRLKPSIYKHLSSLRDKWRSGSFIKRAQTEQKRQWRESEHFAKVMGVVVLLFYISWLPLAISITLTLIIGMTPRILQMTYISMTMTLGGPLIIPIVYGVMANSYRAGYRKAICCLCCGFCRLANRPRTTKIDVRVS